MRPRYAIVLLLLVAAPAGACCADRNDDGHVDIAELTASVGAALNGCPADCPGDCDADGVVTVVELVTAVGDAIDACRDIGDASALYRTGSDTVVTWTDGYTHAVHRYRFTAVVDGVLTGTSSDTGAPATLFGFTTPGLRFTYRLLDVSDADRCNRFDFYTFDVGLIGRA